MKILVACEESQKVTRAFIERGHNAMSCDIAYPGALGLPHYRGDVRDLLEEYFDLVIFHPVCKYIANSGVKHLHTDINRWFKLYEGCEFFNLRHRFNSPKVVTENPIPHKYAVGYIGMYDQSFYQWQHGHTEIRRSCLWLKGVNPLKPSNIVGPPPKNRDKNIWDKVHRASPGPDREKVRSETLDGVARAMAEQWG